MHVLIQHMIAQSSTSTSNPEQETSAPSEKLTSSNPHLHVADDMKHVEGKNTIRSQQQEFVATDDGDDEEEKYEEQKSSSSLRLARLRASRLQEALSCLAGWIEEDG